MTDTEETNPPPGQNPASPERLKNEHSAGGGGQGPTGNPTGGGGQRLTGNPTNTENRKEDSGVQRRLYEFRAQQIAALYEIGLSITAELDLKQVLMNLYDHVQKLLSPEVFYIATYDENTHICEFPLFYERGDFLQTPVRDVHETPGLTGAVILGKQTLVLKDTLDPVVANQYQIIRIGGEPTRTYVGVPMTAHNRTIGVISMQKYAADAYAGEEIRLLETIAIQAAIAIENSQLFEKAHIELEQRRETQAALEKANKQLQAQIEQNEELQAELREQAVRDPLTSLFNRRYLKETLEREISRAKREGSPIGIMIMDIDEFKNVNDLFGHNAGDRMLQAMGELLKANIRAGDIVCRYGGEEFVIVMPGASLQIAYERAELIRTKFDQMYVPYEGELLHATISLGVAAYPIHGTDGEDSLIRADRALYQAKQDGRNRTVAYRSGTKPFPKDFGLV
jgi:diguanylate cyclase (GGDEF)-like protein